MFLKIILKGGASGCDAIAQSFKCTVEKEPDIVVKMVNDAVADVSVKAQSNPN